MYKIYVQFISSKVIIITMNKGGARGGPEGNCLSSPVGFKIQLSSGQIFLDFDLTQVGSQIDIGDTVIFYFFRNSIKLKIVFLWIDLPFLNRLGLKDFEFKLKYFRFRLECEERKIIFRAQVEFRIVLHQVGQTKPHTRHDLQFRSEGSDFFSLWVVFTSTFSLRVVFESDDF